MTRRRRWSVLGLVTLAFGIVISVGPDRPAGAAPSKEVDCADKGVIEAPSWVPFIGDDSKKITLDEDTAKQDWFVKEAEKEAKDEKNCSLAEHAWPDSCEKMNREGTYDDGLVPDVCVGRHPGSAYNILYDEGGWGSVGRKIWGFSTGFVFNISKTAVQVAMWSVRMAYTTKLTDYAPFVKDISAR